MGVFNDFLKCMSKMSLVFFLLLLSRFHFVVMIAHNDELRSYLPFSNF